MPEWWEPVYAIISRRRVNLWTLWAIAGAFAKTSPWLLVLRAMVRALRQEIRWLRNRP